MTKLWDASTGDEVLTLEGHADGVTSVAFSDDGRSIASARTDGTIKVWEVGGFSVPVSDKEGR